MKHKGIIFDMDGTLWDSAENVAKSWNKAIADYGYERAPITKEDMYSVMGKTMDVLASIIFPNSICIIATAESSINTALKNSQTLPLASKASILPPSK